jgi:hypothetical protein
VTRVVEYLNLRATDIDSGDDVTDDTERVSDVTLYLFDQEGSLFQVVTVRGEERDVDIPIILPGRMTRAVGQQDIRVSAWGNTGNFVQILGPIGLDIDTKFLGLEQDDYDDGDGDEDDNYMLSPGETFFGFQTVTIGGEDAATRADADGKVRHSIEMTQKNARLVVTVRGLPEGEDDEYYFRFGGQNEGYDFEGDASEARYYIKEAGSFKGGDFVSDGGLSLVHDPDPDTVDETNCTTIQLYKDMNEAVTGLDSEAVTGIVDRDSSGEYIALHSGMTTNVLIELGAMVDVAVSIEVTDWDEVYQWSTWGR